MNTAPNTENKQIAKVLGPLAKARIKFLSEVSFQNTLRFSKRKIFQAKNRLICLADAPVANLIKPKSTENTNCNRQCRSIDFGHFLASDAKVDGWVGLNL